MATTETAVQTDAVQHLQVAEIETESGYRYWTTPIGQAEMSEFLASEEKKGNLLSDMSCSSKCPACNAEG